LILIFTVVLAACQPASTPTPTPRPTETAVPPTEVPPTEVLAATVEAVVPTEEATMEVAMIPTEEMTMEVAMLPTEEMVEPDEEAIAEMMPTEEMTVEATMEAMMEPTEEMMPAATEAPAMGASVMVSPDESIVIGLASGLSGEGIAPLGIDIQRGAELALVDRPTVTVDGKEFKVSLDVQDDQCSADGGQSVANRFASDGSIVGVVGPMCSSACRAAAPIFDAADYSSVSPSCTAPDLTSSGYSGFNRTVVSDSFQGAIAAQYIYDVLGIRKIATLHDGSPYGEGLVAVVTTNFEALGGEVVFSDAVQVGDTDFRGLLDDVAQAEPELIYFGGFAAEAARLIEQRADAGLENVPFMGADGIQGTEVVDLSGEASEGVYATAAIAASSQALVDFLNRYVETYGEEPPAPYHATAYDAVNLILDGVEAVGTVDANGDLVVDRSALKDYLRSFKDYQGLTGVLNADGTGETSISDIGIFHVENGTFVQVYTGGMTDGNVVLTPYEAPVAEMTAEATMEATEEMAPAATEAPMAEMTPEATAAS
jgi:branched-chain amino acid transport system substrate-binding protein